MKLLIIHTCISFLLVHNFAAAQENSLSNIDFLLAKGDYNMVVKITDSLCTADTNQSILYKNAIANRLNFNYKAALISAEKLLKIDSLNIDYQFEYARCLVLANKTEEAKNILIELFMVKDTANINAGLLLAKIYENEENWIESNVYFDKLLILEPENSYFLYHNALAITRQKKGNQAIPLLQKVLQIDPEHTNSRYLLFGIYKALDQYEEAVAQIDSIKYTTPTQTKPFMELAYYNFAKNYNYKALPEFLKAIELGYPDDDAWHFAGKCYYNLKQYDKAIPYLKYARVSPISDHHLFSLIANCYETQNQTDSALIYHEKAYLMAMPDPTIFDTYYCFNANLKIKMGNYDGAIKDYEKLMLQVDKLRWDTYYKIKAADSIASIYIHHKNQPNQAIRIYQTLLTESTNEIPGYYISLNKKIEAIREEQFFKGN